MATADAEVILSGSHQQLEDQPQHSATSGFLKYSTLNVFESTE